VAIRPADRPIPDAPASGDRVGIGSKSSFGRKNWARPWLGTPQNAGNPEPVGKSALSKCFDANPDSGNYNVKQAPVFYNIGCHVMPPLRGSRNTYLTQTSPDACIQWMAPIERSPVSPLVGLVLPHSRRIPLACPAEVSAFHYRNRPPGTTAGHWICRGQIQ